MYMSDRDNEIVDQINPPRGEVELYGEPVAETGDRTEYYEAYTDDEAPERLFIAKYTRESGKWVKQGLDRHNIDQLFNEDSWPTN